MHKGWVKIHRSICDNYLWNAEPFSRGQAWIDLFILANHQDSFFFKRGNRVDVKRGQVGISEVGLADRWQWSRSKVRNFLKLLEKEHQIEQQKSNVTQVLTIINYDKYQEKEQQKDSRKTAERQQKDTYKNVKKEKNEEELLFSVENPSPQKIGYAQFVDSWNEMAKSNGLPCVQTLSTSRKSKLKTRISEGIKDSWPQLLDNVSKSSFCKGNNNRGWKINFDYLIANDNNWIEIIEGKFADKSAPQSKDDELQAYLSQDAPETSGLF